MKYTKFYNLYPALIFSVIFALAATATLGQTTEFTYQGKLVDNSIPANGNYDLEFQLHAAPTGGAPIGIRTRLNVPVTNGVFTVRLDFAAAAFNGTDRFLEIAVKPAGSGGGYQQLLPRQPINYAPYSIRSLNADVADTATLATNSLQLGGSAANQFAQTTDSRLSDARIPLAGSGNYLQNTTTPQPLTNFNISGNGTLGGTLSTIGTVNTFAQYNIGNNRVLSIAGTNNTFVGLGTGANNNTGTDNSFFGRNAGNANTVGGANSFFGSNAGVISTGLANSFFGFYAGFSNTAGSQNSFFGNNTGDLNTIGSDNAFFGKGASSANTSGNGNLFVGRASGNSNTTGSNNTTIGASADVASNNLNFATAVGAGTIVNNSNTIQLGRSDGTDFVLVPGFLTIPNLAAAGSTQLCRNSFDRIGTCSSSLCYKTNVQFFFGGLDVVRRLRPITFNWKEGGMKDVGFGAEDVEKIEPLLTTRNQAGEIEGVKYGQMTTVLVNAVNEQQTQIEAQQIQIDEQKRQNQSLQKQVDEQKEIIKRQQEKLDKQQTDIEVLKQFICSQDPAAQICPSKEKKQ